ncbi:hypothetical protein SNOUR_10375 [Streptomyces noursei ATCC 11455]|uniref:hypothetical protein n=1 Tax=Streptomyces noursei TaxID=1971 RepID=UPI00081D1FC6|nr:hypothetical protein SNOUR_10375 [Streptomyces noursei ATCC 11455]
MPSVNTDGKRRQARRIVSTSLAAVAAVAAVGLTATAGHAASQSSNQSAEHPAAGHSSVDPCRNGNKRVLFTGPVEGVLKYRAGKLTVTEKIDGSKDFPHTEVSELCLTKQTKVFGALRIGDGHHLTVNKEGYGTAPRTLTQLKKAAKRGDVVVRADIKDNAAIKIWEHYQRG